MKPRIELALHEKLVLLACDTSYGTTDMGFHGKYLGVGVAGAVLFLLLRGGRVTFHRGRFHVRGQFSVGDRELDKALGDLEKKADPFKALRIEKWLLRAAEAELQEAVISGLVEKGILDGKASRYSILNPELREDIVNELRSAILEPQSVNEMTAALAGISNAIGCLRKNEFGDELQNRKMQFHELGRHAGPVIPAVRTAVYEKRLRNSIQYLYIFVAGIAGAFLARYCSS